MRDFNRQELIRWLGNIKLILILALGLSCTETETELGLEPDEVVDIDSIPVVQQVDSLLIGAWKHINFPTAIVIDSLGSVKYYIQNQVSGEFERDERFTDKIKASNGFFEFLETFECAPSNDSTYAFDGGRLRIPIKKSYQSVDVYFNSIEIDSFEGERRPETSYVKADILIDFAEERNVEGAEDYGHQFDSSGKFELMELFTAPNPGSFVSAYDAPDFECNHPMIFHHKISMITDGPIESTGTFELIGGTVQFVNRDPEFGNTYNFSYDNNFSNFEGGSLTVTSYAINENTKEIEGFFEYSMTSEWNGLIDTVTVKNGLLKISELLE